jgi:hypothetical protein
VGLEVPHAFFLFGVGMWMDPQYQFVQQETWPFISQQLIYEPKSAMEIRK